MGASRMKSVCRKALLLFLLLLYCLAPATSRPEVTKAMTEVVWTVDNVESIGGHNVTVLGVPKIVETSQGRALKFDGKQDGLLVSAQPLAGFGAFTVEVIF